MYIPITNPTRRFSLPTVRAVFICLRSRPSFCQCLELIYKSPPPDLLGTTVFYRASRWKGNDFRCRASSPALWAATALFLCKDVQLTVPIQLRSVIPIRPACSRAHKEDGSQMGSVSDTMPSYPHGLASS